MIKKDVNGYMVKPFNEEAIFKTLNTITARMLNKNYSKQNLNNFRYNTRF